MDSIKKALQEKGLRNFPVTNVEPGTEGKGLLGIGTLLERPPLRNYTIRVNDVGNNIVSLSDPANSNLFFITYKNQMVPGEDGVLYAFVVIRTLNPTTATDVQRMLGSTKQPGGTIFSVKVLTEQEYLNNVFQHPVYIKQDKTPLTIPYLAVQTLLQRTPGRLDNVPIGYPDFDSTRSPISSRQGMLPMPPYPNFTTNTGATAYALGATVGFIDTSVTNPSVVAPTGWVWGFTGPTATIPAGSTAQNPIITFGGTGFYTVTLTASNQNGSQSVTKNNFIQIS